MHYRICNLCGAHLDPCEKCTCEQERAEAERLTQYGPCVTEETIMSAKAK